MEAYLALLAAGKLKLDHLPSETYELDQAETGFRALTAPGEKPLLVFLRYNAGGNLFSRKTVLRAGRSNSNRVRVAVVGAGGFAQGMHLPNLIKLRHLYELRSVVSRTGSNALNVAGALVPPTLPLILSRCWTMSKWTSSLYAPGIICTHRWPWRLCAPANMFWWRNPFASREKSWWKSMILREGWPLTSVADRFQPAILARDQPGSPVAS